MKTNKSIAGLVALAVILLLITGVQTLAQDNSMNQLPMPTNARHVPDGMKMKIKGYVIKRGSDTFIMRDADGVDTEVLLTSSTSVKTFRRDVFHGNQTYAVTYILRGLRLQTEGNGNSTGQLVAREIRFDEQDLRTAQSLEFRTRPVEELAVSNEKRITATEENAKNLSGQIEEVQATAVAARADAARAQATADEAVKAAAMANNRLNGLDDYDLVKTITVHFRTGSSLLSPTAKTEMEEVAAWTTNATSKGWVVEVVGFADSRGATQYNRNLSTRRANAVMGYLVSTHNVPLRRIVQPFGFGEDQPLAENTTPDGRAKNRRVEIRVLVNKGIANTIN